MSRANNARRNVISGLLLQAFQVITPFFLRTAMIYFLGIEYVGLNSLFASIFQILNITELGVASAMVYSMYKPIAENDEYQVCSILRLYKIYYRIIGIIVLVAGLIIIPFIPYFIKGDVPSSINIYIIYLISLMSTASSYWMFAYRNSILIANQRVDVANKTRLVVSSLQYIVQFIVLCVYKDYYLYMILSLLAQIVYNILIAKKSKSLFPQYKPIGKLSDASRNEINKRIKDLFISKIGNITIRASDSIVISAFIGLSILGRYQNYNMILTSIAGFITVLFNSITPGIGNSIITETKSKNYEDLNKFTFIIYIVSTFCSCCFLGLFQPFMSLWVGEDNILPYNVVICLTIYFFINEFELTMTMYKDASGIWHKDRFRPFVTAIVNLSLNIIMVQHIGIYGIVLSTVISMLIVDMPWLINNIFTSIFDATKIREYVFKLIGYSLSAAFSCVLAAVICNLINMGNIILTLLIRGMVCTVLPFALNVVLYHRSSEYLESKKLLERLIKRG